MYTPSADQPYSRLSDLRRVDRDCCGGEGVVGAIGDGEDEEKEE